MIEPQLLKTHKELIRGMRKWSKSQAELWQQVPYWALMADGRSAWRTSYRQAYSCGVWTLALTSSGHYGAFVDCANGELIKDPTTLQRLSDLDVLQIGLKELDAAQILKVLRRQVADDEFRPHFYASKNEVIRQEILQDYKLGPSLPYQRPML